MRRRRQCPPRCRAWRRASGRCGSAGPGDRPPGSPRRGPAAALRTAWRPAPASATNEAVCATFPPPAADGCNREKIYHTTGSAPAEDANCFRDVFSAPLAALERAPGDMAATLSLLPAIVLSLQSQAAADAPPAAGAANAADQPTDDAPPPVDNQSIEGRRRPGYTGPLPDEVTQTNPGAVRAPPPEAFPTDQIPIPDRWRLIETLGIVKERWFDPYHQNTLKGDRPLDPDRIPLIEGHDWFFAGNLVSDTVIEPRTFPIPVGVQTTERPGSLDVFGRDASYVVSQTFIAGVALIKGSTAFKPPEIEYRVTLALNLNYADVPERRVLSVEPSRDSERFDQ